MSSVAYKDGLLDIILQINIRLEFYWEIFDEKTFLLATNDNVPLSVLKQFLGREMIIAVSKQKEYFKSIEEAEVIPNHLIPKVTEEANKYTEGYGIRLSDVKFIEYAVSNGDKMFIANVLKDREKTKAIGDIAKSGGDLKIIAGVLSRDCMRPDLEKTKRVSWICVCGKANEGNFCMDCGKPKSFERWLCSCGTKNRGKFCMECGKKLEKY